MKILMERYQESWDTQRPRSVRMLSYVAFVFSFLMLVVVPVQASIIGADGGITLWVSYDNLAALSASVNDDVTQVDSTPEAGCTFTNDARAGQGAPDSPGSCPTGDTCRGRDKLLGDIDNLAEYIFVSTHGRHYLRRVYIADRGRAWTTADIRWNIGGGSSNAYGGGWENSGEYINLNSSTRRCIHDVLHHELGHYFYNLPDRYARSGGYYKGTFDDGATVFDVDVVEGDPNTVMGGNFPHRFVDTTNARLVLSYDAPGVGTVTNQEVTPDLLTDADPDNDGPDRAHHGHSTPFAQDEWSVLPTTQTDLTGVHTEGDFSEPDLASMPEVDVRFLGDDEPFPGTVLLLDRSSSMSVQTNGRPASDYVQEAGLYLYHSAEEEDYVGTFLYNNAVEKLFDYDLYDSTNLLSSVSFRNASGLTNIALALEQAIDALVTEHGEEGVNSGQIVLMSDGKQTTGDSLWDQVDRANDLGIKIHTMTFGNADATTMDQIADNTDASVTPMSELDSAAELKLNMARKMTTLRGNSAIYTYKGPVKVTGEVQRHEFFASEFHVPPRTKDMLFYVFLERNNAADLDIQLMDSAGNMIHVPANSLARTGRFNGMRVKASKPGKWTFKIMAGRGLKYRLPRTDNIEVVAYAANRELNGRIWFDDQIEDYPQRRLMKARLDFRYPLTKMNVKAHVYDGAKHIDTLTLYDDGKRGKDTEPEDGIFSGVLDIKSLKLSDEKQSKRPRKIRVDVEFMVRKKTVPAPNAHYETGSDYFVLLKDYQVVFGPMPFTAYATATTHVRPNELRQPSIEVLSPSKPARVNPGDKRTLKVYVRNARPLRDQLRVSLGRGVDATVTSVQADGSGIGATIGITYKVQSTAQSGKRQLSLQFGKTQLVHPHAITVRGKGKFPSPKHQLNTKGSLWGHSHPH